MNFSPYIGLTWKSHGRTRDGIDCWGLVVLVYLEQFGKKIPSYSGAYASAEEIKEVASLIQHQRSTWRQIQLPEIGDVVLLRYPVSTKASHTGVYVGDGMMLHIRKGANACIERLGAPFWKARVEGYFRHVG